MRPRGGAIVVTDLGFGDAGKGRVVDALTRTTGARLVVRHGGGPQAGHNVICADGRHHSFSQIGAGSFVDGVRTLLGPGMILHPTGLLVEAACLEAKGVGGVLSRVLVHRDARVVTPFHQATGRLRELARGRAPHGTCGLGVGEVAMEGNEALRVHDLLDPHALRKRLGLFQESKLASARASGFDRLDDPRADPEWRLLHRPDVVDRWIEALSPFLDTVSLLGDPELRDCLANQENLVFEGAHGLLLDEWRGFHPHTTWTDCTPAPALAMLDLAGWSREIHVLGVLRAYTTRHGPGPLPTEDPDLDPLLPEPHNDAHGWQGRFRRGHPDLLLLAYARELVGRLDGLVLTHADALLHAPSLRLCVAYEDGPGPRASPDPDLAWQEGLTHRLFRARPRYVPLRDVGELAGHFEQALGVRILARSFGPEGELAP